MSSILVNYVSVTDIAAGPSTTWYANNATNGGNNTGWTFNNVIRVKYLNIVDSSVSGGTWLALYTDGNTNGGNNSGWIFSTPTNSGGFLFFYP